VPEPPLEPPARPMARGGSGAGGFRPGGSETRHVPLSSTDPAGSSPGMETHEPSTAQRRTSPPTGRLGAIAEELLVGRQLEWKDLRIKHLKDIFLSKGSRPCLFFPQHLRCQAEADILHPGRRALRLWFELPKGSYATILVKRITDAAEPRP